MELEIDLPDDEIPTQEMVMQALIDELVRQGSVNLVKYVKLGRTLDELAEQINDEGMGKFGIGMRAVLGRSETETHKIIRLILNVLYDAAGVPRP